MVGALSTAISGMQAASTRVGVAANNIANAGTVDAQGQENSHTDTIEDLVEIKQARIAYSANAAVARVSSDMTGELLDTLA